MSGTEPKLMDHVYDGIQEFDNPTPAWWHAIFLTTILFSLLYFTFYEFSPAATSVQEAWKSMQVAEYERIFGAVGDLQPTEETIQKMRRNPQFMDIAKGIFEGNCAACHAKDGGGINGVNLTDDHYKNVKVITDLFNTITKGANNGAMPSWENRLSANERVIMSSYVASLRGTRPTNPKAPEGEVIPPWPVWEEKK